MHTITYDDLSKSSEAFDASLKSFRAMIHRVCKITGSQLTCPYLKEHGDYNSETCKTCPLRKEQQNVF